MGAEFHYQRLASELEAQIQSGSLQVGQKIPSVRSLKRSHRLSTATVVRAVEELERRGLVESRPRSGTFVKARASLSPPRSPRRKPRPRSAKLHALTETIVEATASRQRLPYGGATLAPELIPLAALARQTRDVLRRSPESLAKYSDSAGTIGLRREISKRLLGYGLQRGPEELVVTSGCMDAMRLALLAVSKPGDLIAVESPTFFGMLQLVRDLRLRAVEVPVDPVTGIRLETLERTAAAHDVRALLVTPNFQNPTGALMPESHKKQLLKISRQHSFQVIESDVYGDLVHKGERPRPLASFSRQVIYCSSFSKTLAPGLRLGWVAPGDALERVRSLKLSGTICSPLLSQQTMEAFLKSQAYERHLLRVRRAITRQVDASRTSVARFFPEDTRMSQPRGGFLLWLQLARGIDSAVLFENAAAQGIALLPGVVCSMSKDYRNFIRLSCGHPYVSSFDDGFKALAKLITAS